MDILTLDGGGFKELILAVVEVAHAQEAQSLRALSHAHRHVHGGCTLAIRCGDDIVRNACSGVRQTERIGVKHESRMGLTGDRHALNNARNRGIEEHMIG